MVLKCSRWDNDAKTTLPSAGTDTPPPRLLVRPHTLPLATPVKTLSVQARRAADAQPRTVCVHSVAIVFLISRTRKQHITASDSGRAGRGNILSRSGPAGPAKRKHCRVQPGRAGEKKILSRPILLRPPAGRAPNKPKCFRLSVFPPQPGPRKRERKTPFPRPASAL